MVTGPAGTAAGTSAILNQFNPVSLYTVAQPHTSEPKWLQKKIMTHASPMQQTEKTHQTKSFPFPSIDLKNAPQKS